MNSLVNLAEQAVETYIKEGKIISPPDNLPEEFFKRKAGTFVTIEKNSELRGKPRDERKRILRGCVGTYLPTKENITQEVISNAIAAATEDYRFSSIQKEELSELSYTVYILNKPELVKDIKELDPQKYGIIVKSGYFSAGTDVIFTPSPSIHCKSGLLLPGLDGINTIEQQIAITCQKAGINPEIENFEIYRFTVEKHQ
jgi:uncharacterized protein (TIGR00296 family)